MQRYHYTDDSDIDDGDDDSYSDEWTDEDAGTTPRHSHHTTTHQPTTDTHALSGNAGQGFQWRGGAVDDGETYAHAYRQAYAQAVRQQEGLDGPGAAPEHREGRATGTPSQARHRYAQQADAALYAAAAAAQARTTAEAAAAAAAAANDADGERLDDDGDAADEDHMMDDDEAAAGGQFDEDYEPTEAEILDYCEWLGVDPVADRPLMWIVREALKAPLPEHWRLCYTEDRELYYFNVQTGESIWDHPLDAFYKALYKQEKAKLMKKRECMRYFSGSLEIKPLAHFFSELGDDEGVPEGEDLPPLDDVPTGCVRYKRQAPWQCIPEALVDAIDFRIFVEPVVLPTSGRTVSRHTIINTRWRDPFSREYVENRRLVPNVDKRSEVDAWLGKAVGHFFDYLDVSLDGLRRALRALPFILDKEEEMCLRAQQRFYDFLKRSSVTMSEESSAPIERKQSLAGTRSGVAGATMRKAKDQRGSTISNTKVGAAQAKGPKASPQPSPRPAAAAVTTKALDLVGKLNEEEQSGLLAALLTMATSTSRECLYFLLTAKPTLASNATFRGFSDEVLHVLHINSTDLSRIAQTTGETVAKRRETLLAELGASPDDTSSAAGTPMAAGGGGRLAGGASSGPSGMWASASLRETTSGSAAAAASTAEIGLSANPPPASMGGSDAAARRGSPSNLSALQQLSYETSNSEHVAAYKWVAALASAFGMPVNALHKLEFPVLLTTVFAMADTAPVGATANTLATMLRGGKGWPSSLAQCPDDAIVKLYSIAARDEVAASRAKFLFDVVWNGGERCLDFFRAPEVSAILADTLSSCVPAATDLKTPYVSPDENQAVDLLGAILVYHECIPLDALRGRPALALRVGYNLLPRLTRSQWRPRHFDSTVTAVTTLIQTYPVMAWRTMQTAGALFLLKELTKKKRNAEETRLKLGGLEAAERRQQQTNAINNWGLLASRLIARRYKAAQDEAQAAVKSHQRQESATTTPREPPAPSSTTSTKSSASPAAAGATKSRFPAVAPRPSPRGAAAATKAQAPPPPPPATRAPTPPTLKRLVALTKRYTEACEGFSNRRDELASERAHTLVAALQTLISMRLKPKPSRLPPDNASRGGPGATKRRASGEEAAAAVPPPPPISSARGPTNGRPPSGPIPSGSRRGAPEAGSVASSCPNLPPIAPQRDVAA